jgi:hypothetical protein
MHAKVDRFISYKLPVPVEPYTDSSAEDIIFKTHLVMTDGQHLMISDAQHGSGWAAIDETLVFMCDESGDIKDWVEVAGGRMTRTDQIVSDLNQYGYRNPAEYDC